MFDLAGAALRAAGMARVAARLTGHPVQALDDLHQSMAPVRARRRIEHVREIVQSSQPTPESSGEPSAQPSTDDTDMDVPGGDGDGGAVVGELLDGGVADGADSGGVFDILSDAWEWLTDS